MHIPWGGGGGGLWGACSGFRSQLVLDLLGEQGCRYCQTKHMLLDISIRVYPNLNNTGDKQQVWSMSLEC